MCVCVCGCRSSTPVMAMTVQYVLRLLLEQTRDEKLWGESDDFNSSHPCSALCFAVYIYHCLQISMNVSGQCPDSHYYLPGWCFLTVWKERAHGKDSLKLKVSIRRAPQLRQSSFPGLLLRWSTGGRRLLNLFSWDALAEEDCNIQRSSYGNTADVSCFYVKPPEVSVALGLMWREQSQFSRRCRCSTMDVVMQT